MSARLAFTMSLALACGGRESHSTRREPDEPESTGVNKPAAPPAPASLEAPSVLAPAEAVEDDVPLATMSAGGSMAGGCSHDVADYIVSGSSEACSARELPACGAGTQPFVDSCGCGCSGTPVQSRECRSDCRVRGSCPAQRFEDFPDLSSTLGAWQEEMQSSPEYDLGGWLVEGSCAGGHRFLYRSSHYVWQASLFTAGGAFLSTGLHGDTSGGPCSGIYFPEPTQCDAGTVTRVWVKDDITPFQVGDPVTLP